jgi:hypothetical protein
MTTPRSGKETYRVYAPAKGKFIGPIILEGERIPQKGEYVRRLGEYFLIREVFPELKQIIVEPASLINIGIGNAPSAWDVEGITYV